MLVVLQIFKTVNRFGQLSVNENNIGAPKIKIFFDVLLNLPLLFAIAFKSEQERQLLISQ